MLFFLIVNILHSVLKIKVLLKLSEDYKQLLLEKLTEERNYYELMCMLFLISVQTKMLFKNLFAKPLHKIFALLVFLDYYLIVPALPCITSTKESFVACANLEF
jgi:hypothetical protein